MRDTLIINTRHGPVLVSKWLHAHWQRYGWPTDATMKKMAESYARWGLPDGREGEEGL